MRVILQQIYARGSDRIKDKSKKCSWIISGSSHDYQVLSDHLKTALNLVTFILSSLHRYRDIAYSSEQTRSNFNASKQAFKALKIRA